MGVEWQATDQFGTLYVGESDAADLDGLRADLASLLTEVRDRGGADCRLTVDLAYQEVSGPDPESVSHILRVPWFAGADPGGVLESVRAHVNAICEAEGWPVVPVGLA